MQKIRYQLKKQNLGLKHIESFSLTKTVCTGCSLLCDDVNVAVNMKGEIQKVFGSCIVGTEKVKSIRREGRILKASILTNSGLREVMLDEAIEEAVKILKNSKKPLIYGWSNTTCEAVRLGLEVAKKLRGVFDSTASLCHGYSIVKAKKLGFWGVSLEEILDYADHVIFWGTNPAETFHRHTSRYSIFPRGLKVPKGVESRIISVVDIRKTKTVKIAHNKLLIRPGEDLKLLKAIEASIIRNEKITEEVAGVPIMRLLNFINDLKRSRYSVIFYGLGFIGGGYAEKNLNSLYEFAKKLNNVGVKCSIIPMAGHYNMVGCVETTLKITGFPYAVDFSTNPLTHNPNKTSVIPLLLNRKVDSALIVGADPLTHLPAKVAENLLKIPLIVLDFVESLTMKKAKVRIPVAVTGVEVGGTVYRLDGKEVKLSPFLKPPEDVGSDEEVLSAILSRL